MPGSRMTGAAGKAVRPMGSGVLYGTESEEDVFGAVERDAEETGGGVSSPAAGATAQAGEFGPGSPACAPTKSASSTSPAVARAAAASPVASGGPDSGGASARRRRKAGVRFQPPGAAWEENEE